jgi:hypothetical protein
VVTSDLDGNLATDGGYIFDKLSSLQNKVSKHDEGLAMAMALSGTPYVESGKSGSIMGSAGFYGGDAAMAMSGVFRLNNNWLFNGGVAVGLSSHNQVSGRVGVQYEW